MLRSISQMREVIHIPHPNSWKRDRQYDREERNTVVSLISPALTV